MPRSRSRKASARRAPRVNPQGVIRVSGSGYAFVQTAEGEFFIPPSKVSDAFDGDVVEVARIPAHGRDASGDDVSEGRISRDDARVTGRVVRVLGRAHETVVGRYEVAEPFGVVVPSDPRISHDVFTMRADAPHVQDGDIVRVRMTAYPNRREPAQGVVVEVLGHEGAPGVDVSAIIARHKLATSFSEAAESEAAAARVDEQALLAEDGVADFTGQAAFTIDPADAKDYDDALSVERDGDGWRVGVHIADVSRYVAWGSAMDFEARQRGTSVYLVDRVLPMLPEAISNDVCSLRPHEPRAAMSVVMRIDARGEVRTSADAVRITPSVIRSRARLAYAQAQSCLDALREGDAAAARAAVADACEGGAASEAGAGASQTADAVAESIGLLHDAARALHAARVRRGGIDFESEEARVRLDAQGRPVGVDVRRKTEATSLVEEAMIAANEAVARFLRDRGVPAIYRVHEPPASGDMAELVPILQEFGYERHVSMSALCAGDGHAIERVLVQAHGRPEEFLVSSLLIRAMKRAEYRDSCEGHFGLASEAYAHFTSPIRRYPDLMVHRCLRTALFGRDGSTSAMESALGRIARHCSETERTADDAARESQELKLFELLADHVGEEFDGIVSGVIASGFFVRLANTAEGFVSLRRAGEYFALDAARRVLVGSDTGEIYRLGMRVRVRVADVWPYERRADFSLVRRVGPRLRSARGADGPSRGSL